MHSLLFSELAMHPWHLGITSGLVQIAAGNSPDCSPCAAGNAPGAALRGPQAGLRHPWPLAQPAHHSIPANSLQVRPSVSHKTMTGVQDSQYLSHLLGVQSRSNLCTTPTSRAVYLLFTYSQHYRCVHEAAKQKHSHKVTSNHGMKGTLP